MFRGLLAAVLLTIALTLFALAPALAADPTPVPTVVASPVLVDPLDPRAGGGAPSVGAPAVAMFVVVGAGIAAAALTFAYVRISRRA